MKRYPENRWIRYLLYMLAVLPIFIFRDFTLDNELRYLSIADEALRKGTFFTFTNHGILYADKPPLYLWIVMLGKTILGYHSLVFLGLFSFLPSLVILYKMDQWVKQHLAREERLGAELMLMTSAFFIGTAIILRMDMLMCMFIVLALYVFFKMYSGKGKPIDPILFPLYVFMAIFSKGPLGLIVPLVSITVFLWMKKQLKTMGRYWGIKTLVPIIGLCALWFGAVYAEGGSKYFNNLLFHQTLNRAVNSFHHNEPFYYYLLSIWYSLIPWSLLLIGILTVGIRKKLVSNDLELFFLVITLSTLVILSLFSAKLAVYMLPAFPFMVYLSALWLQKLKSPNWALLMLVIPAILLCFALPGAFILQYVDFNTTPIVLLSAIIISFTGYFTLKYLKSKKLNRGIITMSTGLLIAIFVFSFAIPKYNSLIGLSQLCEIAKTISREKGVEHYYYCKIARADNLDIYLGTVPKELRIKDLYRKDASMQKPAILFLSHKFINRRDSLRQFVKGRKMHRSGNYYCVEIE